MDLRGGGIEKRRGMMSGFQIQSKTRNNEVEMSEINAILRWRLDRRGDQSIIIFWPCYVFNAIEENGTKHVDFMTIYMRSRCAKVRKGHSMLSDCADIESTLRE